MRILNRWLQFVLPVVGLGLIAYVGFYIVGQGRFSEQGLAFIVLGIVCGAAVLYVLTARDEKRFKQLLIVWPLALGLGYRGADVGDNTIFLPQLLMLALTGTLMLRRIVSRQPFQLLHSPRENGLWFILLLGTLMAVINGYRTNDWLEYWLTFGMFGTFFFCFYELELQAADLLKLLSVLILVMGVVSISGLVEAYLGIGYSGAVVHLATEVRDELTAEEALSFFRVGYVTWGSFLASTIMIMCAAVAVFLVDAWRTKPPKILLFIGMGLCITGVVVSGYRGLWAALGAIFLGALFFRQRQALWSLGVVAGLVLAAPGVYYARFLTLMGTQNFDSSALKRLERANNAWELALRNPLLGVGWNGAGSVHNDWVELAANVGFPAALLFFGMVLWLIFRLFQAQRQPTASPLHLQLARGLCVALAATLIAMLSQTFFSRQLVMGVFWVVFVAAERLLTIWPPPLPAPVPPST